MSYKLLALDIDGTLLNRKSELTPRTKSSILLAQGRGVKVVLATGRRLTNTLPLVHTLGLTEFVVVHNGAVIFSPQAGKTMSQRGIDLPIAQELVDKLDGLGMNYVVYTGESAGEQVMAPVGSWDEPEDLLTHYLGESAEFVEKVKLDVPPVRISLIDRVEKIDSFYRQLASYNGKMNAMVFGTERNIWRGIEIIPANCSKGTGLAEVAKRLGLEAKDVMAIGDNVNDIEMISWAGLGIAMENGSKLLKTEAQRIAPSNDQDGVAQIIEELLL
ncbi:MAG TPA: hypothetical protein DDZ66_03915 [Firmicutes bacterium]|nr:hypothetical protein [Bacillota bacterium]